MDMELRSRLKSVAHAVWQYWNINNKLDVIYLCGLFGAALIRIYASLQNDLHAFVVARWLMGILALPATWRALGFMKGASTRAAPLGVCMS